MKAKDIQKDEIKRAKKVEPYFQNRELSWLDFNLRVLDQAHCGDIPLLEKLNFISIFWSNLAEFFMVRVGSLTDLELVKAKVIDKKSGMTPTEQLHAIYKKCRQIYPYYEETYKKIHNELFNEGIKRLTKNQLSATQMQFAKHYFQEEVMPLLSPQIVNSRHPFPHLVNGALYIIVRLNNKSSQDKSKKTKAKAVGAKNVTLGIIPLPEKIERIVKLPPQSDESKLEFMLIEDLIDMFTENIFSMYRVKHTNIISVTRNADLDVTEGEEEQGEDFRDHVSRILKKRSRLHPVRLESALPLSESVKNALLERLELDESNVFTSEVPLDLRYCAEIPHFIDDKELLNKLTFSKFVPQWPLSVDQNRSIINQVNEKDILLAFPYETMDVLVRMLKEASVDPAVTSIKITLYRLANRSKLAEALIQAAENGKDVTALFELRARFDEFNNIEWSQRFEEAGCHVIYGFKDYKVHSKICCITRNLSDGTQHITQLGTGNYNEKTAKTYTDFSYITTNEEFGKDAIAFFKNMQLESISSEYKKLSVAPMQIKTLIMDEIDKQIELKKHGKSAGLFFKTNAITDKDIIKKLVEASRAGVETTLLVRGVSCIVPGIENLTDNICVVSIVGRLLEHSRIYCFGALDGNTKIYLSSADLMTRNLDKRIEIAWPIENQGLKDEIIAYIGICMSDTAKLRALQNDGTYTPLDYFTQNGAEKFDSQQFLMEDAIARACKSPKSSNPATRIMAAQEYAKANPEIAEKFEVESPRSNETTEKIDPSALQSAKTVPVNVKKVSEMKKVAEEMNSFLSLFPDENDFKMPKNKKKRKFF